MLPTHVLVGLAVAAPVAVAVPELATPILVGALVGSVLPDVDVAAIHRRTFHYPTGYVLAAVPAAALAIAVPTAEAVVLASTLVAAALHCRMDRYGGSHELRPWERKSDRAVYDHVQGRWLDARRWTRYDGAPEDLLVATVAGSVALVGLVEPFRTLAAIALVVGVVYAGFRRRLSDVASRICSRARMVSDRLRAVRDRLRAVRDRLRAGCSRR
ncbi:hypothetical protein JCM18237_24570 [Halorubrum luteum]